MKRLWLLRHAKSSWDDPSLADDERPLTSRGLRATDLLCQHVRAAGIEPALVLCSPAERTLATWERVAGELLDRVPIDIDPALYGATAHDLVDRLRQLADDVPSVLVVGHNPALEQLVLLLVGHGDRPLRDLLATKFPTGALATLDAPVERWAELAWASCALVDFVRPRDLEART
ncbi:MAG: SixA phosphatase family protein [Acidimicrobiales bacterium]